MDKRFAWQRSIAICMLAVLLMGSARAFADEKIRVSIPVIAAGADCAAALYNIRGQRIQLLQLEKDAANAFIVECDGLLQTEYRAEVYSEDNDDVKYDRTVYRIHIYVFYGADDQLQSSVIIEQTADDGATHKEPMIRFKNEPKNPPVTPTPVPAATPEPTAAPTPKPTPGIGYTEKFTFRKVWSGDCEDSIDWVMYNGDGSVQSKLFNKKVISEREWLYEAYFRHAVDDCYIIEYVPEGYTVYYENVGNYAHVTDRCYNGGTIINYKIPQTDDQMPVGGYLLCLLLSGAALMWLVVFRCRRWAGSKQPGNEG